MDQGREGGKGNFFTVAVYLAEQTFGLDPPLAAGMAMAR